MLLFHQLGHNDAWNFKSHEDDGVGDGFIFSPVNTEYDRLQKVDGSLKKIGFLDPQLYLPADAKGKLETYSYSPAKLVANGFSTSDFEKQKTKIAEECVGLQVSENFSHIVIPARYYDEEPSSYYDQTMEYFVEPFVAEAKKRSAAPILFTTIISAAKLNDAARRDAALDWITGLRDIAGVYLIFDFPHPSKQIKDGALLAEALFFINTIINAGLKVYVGYTNTEGLLYSIAMPTAISCGSYENLRGFQILRFTTREKTSQQGPTARVYVPNLYQQIEHTYLSAIRKSSFKSERLGVDSKYSPEMFSATFKWHFSKSQLYLHYFEKFQEQVRALPAQNEARTVYIQTKIKEALALFDEIKSSGIYLDSDSDGSHLPHWLNAITLFDQFKKERI